MTTLVPPPSTTETDDGAAIAELHRLHAVQRKAFLADPYPAAAERKGCSARSPAWCSATGTRSGRR